MKHNQWRELDALTLQKNHVCGDIFSCIQRQLQMSLYTCVVEVY